MKYKFFTIPARDPETAEAALNAFCNQHRVSFVEKQLIADGADSFWSVCVSWQDGEAALSQGVSAANQPKVDYKELLSEEDFSAYLELRNFRKGMAEAKGVPSYALFTNDQLAAMVQRRLYWENQCLHQRINAQQLQTAYAAVHSVTQGTDSLGWRRQNLHHHPPISV